MKKHWIIAAILVALCAAVPVVASEALPTLEKQVTDILLRLDKVEAYEERIETLERQVAELLSLSGVPPEFPSEGTVEMTQAQYRRWVDEEFHRISLLIAAWEEDFESDDPTRFLSAMADILDTAFAFYDAHSRIITPDPFYDQDHSDLACYMAPLEPFRDLESASFMEAMNILALISEEDPSKTLFADCDPEALELLGELLSLE